MRAPPRFLVNTPDIELWPAPLCRARATADARRIAGADLVLRRKRDGRFLATLGPAGLVPLRPGLRREPGIEAAVAASAVLDGRDPAASIASRGTLPGDAVHEANAAMGLPAGYAEASGLPFHEEPRLLAFAGRDRWRRALWLLAPASRAWQAMRDAARQDGVVLEAISGFRSHAYQRGIFERKFARGLSLEAILRVNAAPGHSEHHSGRALDIGTPGEQPAEESFEHTPAFRWLQRRAGDFGFRLSYPRGNPHGITYEPWHWCWLSPASA
ncbi:D-alanyl-D-alanine carboxypeptidase family protein [Silanimonas algicola]